MKSQFARRPAQPDPNVRSRVLSPAGLRFRYLPYNSPILPLFNAILGNPKEVPFHFDADDLSHLYIFEPEGQGYVAISCSFSAYAQKLSLKEHGQILALCHSRRWSPTEARLIAIRRELRSGSAEFEAYSPSPLNRTGVRILGTRVKRPGGSHDKASSPSDYAPLMASIAARVLHFGEN